MGYFISFVSVPVTVLGLYRYWIIPQILQSIERIQQFLTLVRCWSGIIRLREIMITLVQDLHAPDEKFKAALPHAIL